MTDPTPEAYEAAREPYRGQIQRSEWHPVDEDNLRYVVDAVWKIAEATVRAKVAAEIRDAVAIADEVDVTDWQRGYRACAQNVEARFARIAEGKGDETP